MFLIPKASIIFNIFMNVATYLLFTVVCFYTARPPARLVTRVNRSVADSHAAQRLPGIVKRAVTVRQIPKLQTVAVCFCGAAKTTSLGIPLVAAMWSHSDDLTRAFIQIPVLLYTIEQVFLAQVLVYFFRWYLKRGAAKAPDADEEGRAGGETEPGAEKRTATGIQPSTAVLADGRGDRETQHDTQTV